MSQPTPQAVAPHNPQAIARQNFDTLKKLLASPEVSLAIKQAAPKHLTADRQLRVVLTAAMGQPKIAEACLHPAGKASLIKAMLTATQRGWELDGRQAHLVPFNDKNLGMLVQLIPGYQGLVDSAYNHPKVKSIWWNVVHERDRFEFEDGLDRKLVHVKYDGDEEPGPLKYAYAVCQMDGGCKTFVCLNRREVMKAKSCSKGAGSNYSPWSTFESAMWAKTAVRALCKQIPQSSELRDALAVDDEVSDVRSDRFSPDAVQIDIQQPEPTLEPPATATKTTTPAQDDGDLGPQPETKATPAAQVVNTVPAEAKPVTAASAPSTEAPIATPSQPSTANPVVELRKLAAAANLPEEKLAGWMSKRFRLSPCENLDQVDEVSPKRVKEALANWEAWKAEIIAEAK